MSEKAILSITALFLVLVTLCSCTVIVGNPNTEFSDSESVTIPVTNTAPETTVPETEAGTLTEEETETESIMILPKITINELMAKNESFFLNTFDDWVELYNAEDSSVSLDECFLSKSKTGENPIYLEENIEADGYRIFCFNSDTSPFGLSSPSGKLYLFFQGALVDSIEYEGVYEDVSYSPDGICKYITPGYANNATGREEYLKSIVLPSVCISEVMSSNKKYIPVSGEYYDWVEIHNRSSEVINLGDYYLSDRPDSLNRGRLPSVMLAPGAYRIIYCSGIAASGHVPFKISSSGEKLYLSKGSEIIDYVEVPADLKQNESYGRVGNTFAYMDKPTPGSANGTGRDKTLGIPVSNLPSGSYNKSVTVELGGEGKIYYTLDGTDPTDKSLSYTGPISVSKNTIIRTICKTNTETSSIASYTYLINAKHEHPVIEISIKEEWLRGSKGIMTNPTGTEYEYQCCMTMMDNGVELFTVPCGLKLHGNDSKKGAKQNFQIRFRSKYGLGTFEYPLFDNRDYDTFNSLILHGGSEDYPRAGFRDELCTAIVDGSTNLYVLAARPVVLYLNGEYRGIYWLRERFDALYCANNLGVSRDSINNLHTYGTASDGSNKTYLSLLDFCKKNDMKKEENYKYVMDRIDAKSLMDWYICRSYFADRDLANIRFFQSTGDDEKWHWCFFDLDWAFYHDGDRTLQNTMPNNGCHTLILSLLQNEQFKEEFIKRCIELINGPLSDENINKYIDVYEKQFRTEAAADRAKYGYKVSSWEQHVQNIRDYIGEGKRRGQFLNSVKSYFGLSASDLAKYIASAPVTKQG